MHKIYSIKKEDKDLKKRNVSEAKKRNVAGKQFFKCANKPGSKLDKLENYECPLWKKDNDKGSFDESGYDIDHIIEHALTQDDSIANLQALCKSCHSVKTKRFMIKDNVNNKDNVGNKDMNIYILPLINDDNINYVNNANIKKFKTILNGYCYLSKYDKNMQFQSYDNVDNNIKNIQLECSNNIIVSFMEDSSSLININIIFNSKRNKICKKNNDKFSDYLQQYTCKQLKEICRLFNIAKSGNKDDIINRIIEKVKSLADIMTITNNIKTQKYFVVCYGEYCVNCENKFCNCERCKDTRKRHEYYTNNINVHEAIELISYNCEICNELLIFNKTQLPLNDFYNIAKNEKLL